MRPENWPDQDGQPTARQEAPTAGAAASSPAQSPTPPPSAPAPAAAPATTSVPPVAPAYSQPVPPPEPGAIHINLAGNQSPPPPQPERGGPTPPVPPAPPAGGARRFGQPPQPPRRGGLGWPLAFLLLGLAMVGGCCYSFANFTSKIILPMELTSSQPSVGVLVMEDEIMGSVWATDVINRFKKDPNIKSVVIRINSPGGAVAPCQEIYKALKGLDKPVVISMGSVAASGGLYVAAAGDHIMANPGTITGSIGVIMQSVEVTGTMDKLGLTSQTIKSGEYKDIGSPFRPMRANERELLQKMVNQVYEQFLADLTDGRKNMSAQDIRRLADGRIFTGAEAKELGLVDEIGGFEEALVKAATLGGLPPKRPELVVEDGRKPWWETVMYSQSRLDISLPPALSPGFSLKYIYQPELGAGHRSGN